MLEETIVAAMTRSREMVSVLIMNVEVVDNAWTTLEHRRILKEIEYMKMKIINSCQKSFHH